MSPRRRSQIIFAVAASVLGVAGLLGVTGYATEQFVVLRLGWLVFGLLALFYSARKVVHARRGAAALDGDGAMRLDLRWRSRDGMLSVAISLTIVGAAVVSIADVVIPGPALFSAVVLILLTAFPMIWTYKQVDDDVSHDELIESVRTQS